MDLRIGAGQSNGVTGIARVDCSTADSINIFIRVIPVPLLPSFKAEIDGDLITNYFLNLFDSAINSPSIPFPEYCITAPV